MFQRCRESACKLIETLSFKQILKRKSPAELSLMLEQGQIPFPANMRENDEAKILAKTIFRSAIKTALVTKYSWHDQLQGFMDHTMNKPSG